MSETEPFPEEELARQARQHLESLRAAGVDWLPDGHAPRPQPAGAASAAPTPSPTTETPVQPAAGDIQGRLWGPGSAPAAAPEGVSGLTVEQRKEALTALARRVSQCTRCPALSSTRSRTVFGVGPLDPELCFIGEAPGGEEDRLGEPFVGPAGQLLDRIIVACGMKRQEVFICNILRCRPPGNRTPLPDEAKNCQEYLEQTLALVRPKFLCALGVCAATNLLGVTQSMSRLRGRFHDYQGIPVLCTYHPSYLLRNPPAKRDVWEDMKKLLARMGKPIPARNKERRNSPPIGRVCPDRPSPPCSECATH